MKIGEALGFQLSEKGKFVDANGTPAEVILKARKGKKIFTEKSRNGIRKLNGRFIIR